MSMFGRKMISLAFSELMGPKKAQESLEAIPMTHYRNIAGVMNSLGDYDPERFPIYAGISSSACLPRRSRSFSLTGEEIIEALKVIDGEVLDAVEGPGVILFKGDQIHRINENEFGLVLKHYEGSLYSYVTRLIVAARIPGDPDRGERASIEVRALREIETEKDELMEKLLAGLGGASEPGPGQTADFPANW